MRRFLNARKQLYIRRTYVVLTGKAVLQYSIPGRANGPAVVEAKTPQCGVLSIWFCKRQVQSKIWRVTNKFEENSDMSETIFGAPLRGG